MPPSFPLLRRARQWLERRPGRGPVILMYHRVAEVAMDPWGLCVSPDNFAEHLEVVRRIADPVPLHWLTERPSRRRLPPRSVVVTFDDGYADLLHAARPRLEAKEVPATAFITTGNLGTDREFWWDELERLLLKPGTLPATLELSLGGEVRQWDLGDARDYSADAARMESRARASSARAGTRHALFRTVWKALFPLAEAERLRTLDALRRWAGDPGAPRPEFRSLRPDEVEALAAGGLVEIGAHTVNHPALSAHGIDVQRAEILESKAALERILGRAVTSFCYPHGEYSPVTLALMREAELLRACTVRSGCVTRRTDPLQLPRYAVEDWPAAEFEERLSGWLGGGKP